MTATRGHDGAAAPLLRELAPGGRPLNSTPGGLLGQRCDPYGAESKIQLMGGLHPERDLGRHMWHCDRLATGRFRMVCRHGHRGHIMPLCGPGLVRGPAGAVILHPGHIAEISRRQSDMCPKCIWPPEALAYREADLAGQNDLRQAMMLGDRAGEARAKQKMLDAGRGIDELMTRGLVHKCPLRLEGVA
jgi:hypothetical protein